MTTGHSVILTKAQFEALVVNNPVLPVSERVRLVQANPNLTKQQKDKYLAGLNATR